jgi:hypothetical protein
MNRLNFQTTTIGSVAGVLLLAVATSPFWTVLLVKRHAEQIVNNNLHSLASSSLAGVDITDGFVEITLAIATTDRAVREEKISEIDAVSRRIDSQLKAYAETIRNEWDQARYDDLLRSRQAYRQTRARVLELLQQDRHDEAVRLFQEVALGEFVSYKNSIDLLVKQAASEAAGQGREIVRLCNYLLLLQGVLLVFFFIYAFFVPLVTLFEKIVTRKDPVLDI